MKKRDLFVFAGQSNMMGAAVLPPREKILTLDSYEYKHKPKRLGAALGDFVPAGYPCGEFSYTEETIKIAYLPENTDADGRSTLTNYGLNTYFCPSMRNLKSAQTHEECEFDSFSESSMMPAASLAPLFAEKWEEKGQRCAYAHIAKGAIPITHYFEASAYFDQKVVDFFADAEIIFPNEDHSVKAFVWCQGESDAESGGECYKLCLEILWSHLQGLGFTHFFCVRVGFWNGDRMWEIMQAQEEFCREHSNCYIVTRAMSMMPFPEFDNAKWFIEPPGKEYEECRDSYFGYRNQHINEKGFSLIAQRMADNVKRILREGREPILEKEIILPLITTKQEETI